MCVCVCVFVSACQTKFCRGRHSFDMGDSLPIADFGRDYSVMTMSLGRSHGCAVLHERGTPLVASLLGQGGPAGQLNILCPPSLGFLHISHLFYLFLHFSEYLDCISKSLSVLIRHRFPPELSAVHVHEWAVNAETNSFAEKTVGNVSSAIDLGVIGSLPCHPQFTKFCLLSVFP